MALWTMQSMSIFLTRAYFIIGLLVFADFTEKVSPLPINPPNAITGSFVTDPTARPTEQISQIMATSNDNVTTGPPIVMTTGITDRQSPTQASNISVSSSQSSISHSSLTSTGMVTNKTDMTSPSSVISTQPTTSMVTQTTAPMIGECGGTYSAIRDEFYSPRYPYSYPAGIKCVYRVQIQSESLKYVSLRFLTFDLKGGSCYEDYVSVKETWGANGPLIGIYCGGIGRSPPPLIVTGETDGMYIEFISGPSNVDGHTGFHAEYAILDTLPTEIPSGNPPTMPSGQCGGAFDDEITRYSGFGSPYHPDIYPPDQNCTYTVRVSTSPVSMIVEVNFTAFELQFTSHCDSDYVILKDGRDYNSPVIGQYCGSYKNATGFPPPTSIMTREHYISVQFVSDSTFNFEGFYMNFQAIPSNTKMTQSTVSICNNITRILTDRGGLLLSHDEYGVLPYANEDNVCEIKIQGRADEKVYIDIFQNDLRATDSSCNVATDDSITILPNGRVLCRQDRGRFTSPSGYNSLTVKFTTHHYENGGNSAGFKAVYTVFYEADASRTCQGNDYFCMYDRWCIAEYLVCDGYYHCSQGTDEYNCGKSSSDWLFTLLVLVVIFGACVLACGYKKYNHRGSVTSRRPRSRRESSDQLESPTLEFDGPASPPVPPPYSEEPPEYTEIYDPSSLGIDNPALEMSMTSLTDQNLNTYEIPDEPPPSYEFALSNSTENIVDTAEEGGETTSADNESLQQGSDNETADSGIHFVENESSSLSGETRDNCEQPDHEDDGRPQPAANNAELSSDNITPCLPNESSSSSPEVNNEGEENSTPSEVVCEREDNSNTEYEIPVAEGNESPTTEDTRTRANILDEDTTSNRDDRDDEVSDGDGEVNTVCMFFGGNEGDDVSA